VLEVGEALARQESVKETADGFFERGHRPLCRGAQQSLELREGQFDRVEVRTVRRQVDEPRPNGFDGVADAGRFVGRQIVHDHHVAGAQRGDQLLLDVLSEGVAVHRSVDHRGGDEAAGAEGADERRRLPMSVGNFPHHAHAPRPTAVKSNHLGVRGGLVEEDQVLRMQVRLPESPQPASLGDVRPILLRGMQDFF